MFRIGEFSKLSRVTVKALRFYDELGLLTPVRVDDQSGYRYYSADQLPRLNRILALKDLGLTLEEIGDLLRGPVSGGDLRALLDRKRAEVAHRIAEEAALLSRVEARLTVIEREDAMGTDAKYEVALRKVDPVLVASIRRTIPAYNAIGQLYEELGAWCAANRIRPAGPAIAVWHDPEFRERDVDGEAAFPLDHEVPGTDTVKVHRLPGVEQMACVVHHGAYNALPEAYGALMTWIQANGYHVAGPGREVYLQTAMDGNVRQDDPSYVTEVQFPVERG